MPLDVHRGTSKTFTGALTVTAEGTIGPERCALVAEAAEKAAETAGTGKHRKILGKQDGTRNGGAELQKSYPDGPSVSLPAGPGTAWQRDRHSGAICAPPRLLAGWSVVVAAALLLLCLLMRQYALRVQDRVIRLEERIRMAALLPLESRRLQQELTSSQVVALRFASDAELAGLTEKAAEEHLSPKVIKQRIANWRPDHYRV